MAVLAVEGKPRRRAVLELDAPRPLHMHDEGVDGVVEIKKFEALALERARLDLGPLRIGFEAAAASCAPPSAPVAASAWPRGSGSRSGGLR